VLVVALALSGCGGDLPASPSPAPSPARQAIPEGYLRSPAVTAASARTGGQVTVTGVGAPGARVRLATPTGQARFATADDQGRWSMSLPAADQTRVFGLSMTLRGRQVQGQGYVLLTPSGRFALLRAGAGAVVSGPAAPMRLTALDFDAEGGAVVSGFGPANSQVQIQAGGVTAGTGKVDGAGRFSVALNQPLRSGGQRIEALIGSGSAGADLTVTPAQPLTGGPFRSTPLARGARIDWLTPGGGLQSTLILD
jgi:hypothetical protein